MYLNGVTQNILSTFGKTIDFNVKGTDNNTGNVFDSAYHASVLRTSSLFSRLTSAGSGAKKPSENPGWNDIGVCIQPQPSKCPTPANTDPKLAPLNNFLTSPDKVNYDIEESINKTGSLTPELQTQVNDINKSINTLPANNNEVWSKIKESDFMDIIPGKTYTPTGFMNGFTTQDKALTAARTEYPDEAAFMVKINGGGAQVPCEASPSGREVIYNSGTQFKVTGKNENDGLIYLSPINQQKVN